MDKPGPSTAEIDITPIPATMQAAVYRGVNNVRLETVTVPSIGPGEMLVRVHSCGVCGTDLHILKGHWPKQLPWPFTLGHELGGVIVEAGAAADLFRNPQTDYTRALFAAAFNLDTAPEGVVAQ